MYVSILSEINNDDYYYMEVKMVANIPELRHIKLF